MRYTRTAHVAAALLLTVLLSGCREGGPGGSGYLVGPERPAVSIAVMPFDTAVQRSEDLGQVVAQEVVTALLASGQFEVVEPGAVYAALVELGVRNGYGLSPATMEKLQDRIGPVDIFVVGIVQDFGDVRVGPATYPTISINARVIHGYSGRVLWSGSVSRTGSDSEKFFGMGAVHSAGRLARAAVRDLVSTIDQPRLMRLLELEVARDSGADAEEPVPRKGRRAGPGTAKRTGNERFFDENAMLSEADLRGTLVDIDGMVKGPVRFRQHHFSIVDTTYDGSGAEIKVKLVDYRKADAAMGYVGLDHPGVPQGDFAGLPAFAGNSDGNTPGAYYLDVAAGRFGLFLLGPANRQADIELVANSLVASLK